MIGVDVSHDVLAALIGALAIVIVAIAPRQFVRSQNQRRDLVDLRERVDVLSAEIDHTRTALGEIVQRGQEARSREHQELKDMLRTHNQLVETFLNQQRWKGER